MKNSTTYWDTKFSTVPVKDWDRPRSWEYIRKIILRYGPSEEKSLLDVGCGVGDFTRYLAQHEVYQILKGIDRSPWAIHYAQEHTLVEGEQYAVGEAYPLEEDYGFYDVVTINETLEHLPDPLQFILEAWRVLKIGGILLISTPYHGELGGEEEHEQVFTLDSLGMLVLSVFDNVTFYPLLPWFPDTDINFRSIIAIAVKTEKITWREK